MVPLEQFRHPYQAGIGDTPDVFNLFSGHYKMPLSNQVASYAIYSLFDTSLAHSRGRLCYI